MIESWMKRREPLITASPGMLPDFLSNVDFLAVPQNIFPLENRLIVQATDKLSGAKERQSRQRNKSANIPVKLDCLGEQLVQILRCVHGPRFLPGLWCSQLLEGV